MNLPLQAGGTLRRGALYIEREADVMLFDALARGEFCYVLGPRQIGKSSLRSRVAARLRLEGLRCAHLDLSEFGTTQVTPEQWYLGLLTRLGEQFGLGEHAAALWQRMQALPPQNRLIRFLMDEVPTQLQHPVVVFLDEINVTQSLPFDTDDFYGALRAIYNAQQERSERPVRIALIGVATPGDLVKDAAHTPFNIGQRIGLDDFTLAQARAFLPYLGALGGDAEQWLAGVLAWTSGHPYMTQAVLVELLRAARQQPMLQPKQLEVVINGLFHSQRGDANLHFTDRYFAENRAGERQPKLLALYRRLLDEEEVPARPAEPLHQHLLMTGMAGIHTVGNRAMLRVRNRIFAQVFSREWVNDQLRDRPLSKDLAAWLRSGRSPRLLLRGLALRKAEQWTEQRRDVTDEELGFLLASLEAESSAQRRALRWRWATVGCSLVLSLLLGRKLLHSDKVREFLLQRELLIKNCHLDHQARACREMIRAYVEDCEQGQRAKSCRLMATFFQIGFGVPASPQRAALYFNKACRLGDDMACTSEGSLYLHMQEGEAQPSYDKARRLFKDSCDRGFDAACDNLGYLYERGHGVPKDPRQAFALYDQSCQRGSASACNNLGHLLQSGQGITPDPQQAREFFSRACIRHDEIGCLNLGFWYEKAEPSPDPTRAAVYYEQACERGSPEGCTSLGLLHRQGRGVNADLHRAQQLYAWACESWDPATFTLRSPRACNNLAALYETGQGVAVDQLLALDLYDRACHAKYALACQNQAELLQRSPGLLPEALRLPKIAFLRAQAKRLGVEPSSPIH